jgi:hypothetical protein
MQLPNLFNVLLFLMLWITAASLERERSGSNRRGGWRLPTSR